MSFGIRDFYSPRSLSLKIGDERESALFRCGEHVELEVVPHMDRGLAPEGEIVVRTDDGTADGVRETSFRADGPARLVVCRETPGFVRCTAEWRHGGETAARISRSIGFSVEEIRPDEPEPEGFAAFWKGLLDQAAALPEQPFLTPVPECDDEKTRLFELCVPTLNGKRMYGFVSIPKAEGKYPVIICYPGSGPASDGRHALRYEDAISLFMNVHFYRFEPGVPPEETAARVGYNPNGYATFGIESRDTYFYHDVVPGISRAVSFMASLPQFNGKDMGVFGSSQGGWLSIMSAAFHPEITAMCLNVPAFCQLDGFLAVRKEMEKHADDAAYLARVLETLRWYSSVHAAKRIRAAAAVIVGRIDECCPPTGIYAMFNELAGKKKMFNEMDMRHECRASWSEGIQALHDFLVHPRENVCRS